MKSKEIEINGKKFSIHELKYLDIIELATFENKKEHAIKLFEMSGINKEITESLSIEEGKNIIEEINLLNGFGDFTVPVDKQKKN